MKKQLLISLFAFLFSFQCIANQNFFSGHLKTQYAGELGFLSAGIGKAFLSWYELTAMYGYVPSYDEGPNIHTFALKQDFTF